MILSSANTLSLRAASNLLRVVARTHPQRSLNVTPCLAFHNKALIGNRDIVGFGFNGEYSYVDRVDFPMPAIRFKENSAEIMALREREKGDWKCLTMEEKKALYRASFCQTFAEIEAPTGHWKPCVSGILVAVSLAFWFYIWMKTFVYPELPCSFSDEARQAQMQRMIDIRVNRVEGLTSNFDYENNRWK